MTRWLVPLTLALVTAIGLSTPSTAWATAPVTLDPDYVTDQAGVLSATEEQAVEARLQELSENSDVDLFVVLVDDFTSPSDSVRWADAVADDNNLGPQQYLLAIAVEGRSYYISAATDGPLSDSKLDDVEDKILPLASQQDWDGAIVLAADEIQGDGGAGMLRVVLIIAGIAAAVLVIWLIVKLVARARRNAEIRRRGAMPDKPDPDDPFSTLTDEQVETQARTALVQADNAITSSREELGFAVAQFGEGVTEQFSRVVEAARVKLREAFELQQKLDDEVEDSIHDRRAWFIRIVELCDEIDDLLDDNTEAFDELRHLARNAPQELERVRGQRAELEPILHEATSTLATLSTTYDPAALSTVADNPAQAQERAALADRAIASAAEAIAAGDTGEAAFGIRTAEQAVAQAAQLGQAITALAAELAQIETQARALIAELQGDITASRDLPDPSGTVAAATTAARSELEQAQQQLAAASRNPHQVLEALTSANTQIDAALAAGRQAAAHAQRTQQLLDQTIAQATSSTRAAREFIETRRGVIGSTARTRLSQAEATLTQAIDRRASDPESALGQAQRALELARAATWAAESDVHATSTRSHDTGWGGDIFGAPAYRSADSGLAGDILGGIIGGLLSGGGGGSSRRSSGGWRSSGGFRSSGFGGGGRSSRRSSGGRSGGRSGRSGGRRF